ncbi:hypothetical protein ACSBR2_004626 [Camellia fascicularis]
MANDGQKEKIWDNIPTGSSEHFNPNVEEDNCNEKTRDQNPGEKDVDQEGDVPKKSDRGGYYNENDLQVWKDRCLQRDGEMKGMANKLADLQSVVNFMMQNNVMQPPFPLQDTLIPMAKNNAQKRGQKTASTVPQHIRTKEHSHQPSREVGRGESMKGDSWRTHRTKEVDPKEHQHIQGKELYFDTTNGERSKRTHNDTESSASKRLKSIDSRAPGRTKEDLRDYLQRKRQDVEVTLPVKPRTPFSVQLDKFEAPKRFHMPRF